MDDKSWILEVQTFHLWHKTCILYKLIEGDEDMGSVLVVDGTRLEACGDGPEM